MLDALSAIVWDVDPVLLELGPLTFRYYGILFASALMIGYSILRNEYEAAGEDPEDAVKLTYALVAGIVLGARIGHVVFYEPERYWNACFHPLKAGLQQADCLMWLKFWQGGLASHGATIGMIVVVGVYVFLVRKIPFRVLADRLALTLPIAVMCVRFGNLFNSEIVGRQTDAPWGFIFPNSVASQPEVSFGPVVYATPRHPSQLYEALIGLFVFLLIWGWGRWYKKKGQERPLGLFLFVFIAFYFGLRFFAEGYKEYQTDLTDWTMGQYLSVPFAAIGFLGIWAALWGPWKGQTASQFLKKERAPRTVKKAFDLAIKEEMEEKDAERKAEDEKKKKSPGEKKPKKVEKDVSADDDADDVIEEEEETTSEDEAEESSAVKDDDGTDDGDEDDDDGEDDGEADDDEGASEEDGSSRPRRSLARSKKRKKKKRK